jgi:hypothetical protein
LNQHWIIYALGGGWGHLNRALSLGRVAVKQRKITIITNSPYIDKVADEGCTIKAINPDAGYHQTCQKIQEIITQTNYNCLIVDTFPRGLGGELADILPKLENIPKILIHRDINPHYVAVKNLREFVTQNFDGIIVPGEGEDLPFGDLPKVYHTAPWLIRSHGELENRKRMDFFKNDYSQKIILVCASGNASELPIFTDLAIQLEENFPDCLVKILAANHPPNCPKHLWICHHPGIECIAAADIVVGGAGYNTVYECISLGLSLIAIALPRKYDCQVKRATKTHQVQNTQSAILAVKQRLQQIQLNPVSPPQFYVNGVIDAVNYIQKIIG